MAKLITSVTGMQFYFKCPACNYGHRINVDRAKSPAWEFNGDKNRPTFRPSYLIEQDEHHPRCHLYITDGVLEFEPDCSHAMAGQKVEMVNVIDE